MSIRDVKGSVDDLVRVENVIVSVFDKKDLGLLAEGLLEVNGSAITFFSTGGTYKVLKEIAPHNTVDIAHYTGAPEMEGGLVKTLHPKIHAGILGERNNPEHQRYIAEQGGRFFDMVVVNLYPFQQVVDSPDVTFEKARGNIDIGGPTMLRAAAKNFLGCAPVCDPLDYTKILETIRQNKGCTTFEQRLGLASKVFKLTSMYDGAIARFVEPQVQLGLNAMKESYGIQKGN